MHPRSKHNGRYDFEKLTVSSPGLSRFVIANPQGDRSIDFANPAAVKALNQSILKQTYGVESWDIPSQYLCPAIPGRADLIHAVADLLALGNGGKIPRGEKVRVLDIGVGANCVYPLIGNAEYGWRFLGSESDQTALDSAQKNVDANPRLKAAIDLRLQPDPSRIFMGLLKMGESFDVSISNPPFHSSLEEAQAGSRRKWNNLGKAVPSSRNPVANFSGKISELVYPGGEAAFIGKMIEESSQLPKACRWFTTLVSKEASLPAIFAQLERARAHDVHRLDLSQGQKKSRIVAWTFQS